MRLLSKTLVAALLGAAGFAAQAQEVTLKVHHFLGPQSTQQVDMFGTWCGKLAKESAGKLKCQLYPSMQLGGTPPQLYDQAKDGVADIVWTVAGYSSGRFPKIEVFELPFMMTNAEATSRAAWEFYDKYDRDEFKDTHILAVHVHGPGNIYTVNKPITQLSDFRGLKLRAPTRLTNKMLAMMGATPVGMPVPAVPEALSKGVIDGAVIPYEVAPGIKVNELTKFTAEPDRSYNALYTTVFLVAMNKAKYESLPPDLKKVLDANSGADFSAFMGKTQAAADAPGKEKMIASGNKITPIPAAELEKWKKATSALDEQWSSDITSKGGDGKMLLQAARDLVKKNTK
ncbi:MAG: TRAP transporter substrate-binding protein [Gammaproteobacteria bacterium]|nr:TRAP transporter substrate-binding protein [Gammaproteobacteria bacterium]MBU1439681.1 TRAP transporter substrate-binding protein [Gammaproteobacteria bacterium]